MWFNYKINTVVEKIKIVICVFIFLMLILIYLGVFANFLEVKIYKMTNIYWEKPAILHISSSDKHLLKDKKYWVFKNGQYASVPLCTIYHDGVYLHAMIAHEKKVQIDLPIPIGSYQMEVDSGSKVNCKKLIASITKF